MFIDVLRHANTSFFHVPVKSETEEGAVFLVVGMEPMGALRSGAGGASRTCQWKTGASTPVPMENWSSSKHRESWCLDLD